MVFDTRRFTFSTVKRKRKNRRKQDREDEEIDGEADRVSSHMTCHDIVTQNETFIKFIVYQKLEW